MARAGRLARARARGLCCAALAGSALLLGAACTTRAPLWEEGVQFGPFYRATNVAADPVLPVEIRRVVLLPVYGGRVVQAETAQVIERAVIASLQAQQRFEVVTLPREDLRRLAGAEELSAAGLLPAGFMELIEQHHGADAVMFVEVTHYRAYPPQEIGLRARLVSLREGRAVWNFDELVSAADAAVRNSARRRYFEREHGAQPFDLSRAGLQSPGWFAGFVADEMCGTLPRR